MRDLEILEPMANEQGWNDETCLLLAVGFIGSTDLMEKFIQHLKTVQMEENAVPELAGGYTCAGCNPDCPEPDVDFCLRCS